MRLLLALSEPVASVQAAAVAWHQRRLSAVLDRVEAERGVSAAADDSPLVVAPVEARAALDFVKQLNEEFLDHYAAASTAFADLFEGGDGGGDGGDDAERQAAAHAEWVTLTRALFSRYFALVKSTLCAAVPARLRKAAAEKKEKAAKPDKPAAEEGDADGGAEEGDDDAADAGAKSPRNPFADDADDGDEGVENPFAMSDEEGGGDGDRGDGDGAGEGDAGSDGGDDGSEKKTPAASSGGSEDNGGDESGEDEGDEGGPYGPIIAALRLIVADVRTAASRHREARLVDRAAETVETVR